MAARLVWILAVALAAPATSFAQERGEAPSSQVEQQSADRGQQVEGGQPAEPGAQDEAPRRVPNADGRRTLAKLPASIGRGITGVFARESLIPLFIGAGGSALTREIDDNATPIDGSDNSFGKAGQDFGNPLYVGGAAVAMFIGGRLATGQRFRNVSYDLLVATTVNFLYTEALKQTFPRERPNMENRKSFPSGHTSNAFAWAAVLDRHFGIGMGAPMYMVASTIAASRVTAGKHYVSDVVAGAAIGFIVGRAVVRKNREPTLDISWTLAPTTGPSGQPGILAVIDF